MNFEELTDKAQYEVIEGINSRIAQLEMNNWPGVAQEMREYVHALEDGDEE